MLARGLQTTLLVSLSGCLIFGDADDIQATVSGDSKVSFDALRAKDPQAKLGAKEHPKILAANGGAYKSAKLEQLLAPIAGALLTFSDDPERAYDITVLNSPAVNAFALPGGYLYVTRGLLALANDQSEVAAVLAHEIAHVSSNHGIERSRQAKAAGIAERVVNDVVTSDIAGKVAKANTARRMSSFSQTQELQADAIGIKMLGKSGYDPFAAARFLESMKRFAGWRSAFNSDEDDMSSSHPSTPQRVELAKRHARTFGPEGSVKLDRNRFLAGLDGMLFGDAAKEGYVRGNTFSHSKLNVTFRVPDNFELTNRAEAVLASGPNETALRFDAVSAKGYPGASRYIASGWVNGLLPQSVQPAEINGMEAATALAVAGDWQFAVTVIAWKNRYFRFILAAPKANTNVAQLSSGIVQTFRKMTAAEKAALKPLRLKIVTVGASDTIASLASRMKGVSRKVQLFRALNELDEGDRVKPGTKVKTVAG